MLFIAAANISLTPMIPLILYASYRFGAPIVGGNAFVPEDLDGLSLATVHQHVVQYATGAVALALTVAAIGTTFSFALLRVMRGR